MAPFQAEATELSESSVNLTSKVLNVMLLPAGLSRHMFSLLEYEIYCDSQ